MKNGWRIIEKKNFNESNKLEIFVDGKLVETVESHSIMFLSNMAHNRYMRLYNTHTASGWRYAL